MWLHVPWVFDILEDFKGVTGAPGLKGAPGEIGPTGGIGLTGPKGSAGDTGPQGEIRPPEALPVRRVREDSPELQEFLGPLGNQDLGVLLELLVRRVRKDSPGLQDKLE